jgi:tetratricopeptide (TPR) repeat protein
MLYVYENYIYRNVKYGALMIGVFSIIHTASWLYTNKTDKSILWVESAFSTDPAIYYRHTFNNESMLAAVFSGNKLHEQALKWGKLAYFRYRADDPRMGYNYARDLIALRRFDEARVVLEDNIVAYPLYAPAYTMLIEFYQHYKLYADLHRILEIFDRMYKQVPDAFTTRMNQDELNKYFSMLNDLRNTAQTVEE